MERAQEDARVERRLAVDQAELDALLHVSGPIVALDHGDDVLALQATRPIDHLPIAEQWSGLLERGEKVEELRGVLLAISHDGVPDRRDAREIAGAEPDDALSPFDVLRGDAHLLHEGVPRRTGLVCHPLGPPLPAHRAVPVDILRGRPGRHPS